MTFPIYRLPDTIQLDDTPDGSRYAVPDGGFLRTFNRDGTEARMLLMGPWAPWVKADWSDLPAPVAEAIRSAL